MLKAIAVSLLLIGCSKSNGDNTKQEALSGPAQEARNLFNSLCSTCHGQGGHGDGSGAAALNPKPRNYTDKAWQARVTNDEIRKIIVEGGAAVGKSPQMPANPNLRDRPDVVEELVKIVRSFGQ